MSNMKDDEDMEDMKDVFLHSLMKNMSDGMVNDVKTKNSPIDDEELVSIHGGYDPEQPEEDPEDEAEDEQEQKLTDMLKISRRPMYRNNW